MKEIKRIRHGERPPEGGSYLSTVRELDHARKTYHVKPDFLSGGLLGEFIGHRYIRYTKTPEAVFHYYEVDAE